MSRLVKMAVLLIVLVNISVLLSVAYNRSGEPVATIDLTERELPVIQRFNKNKENSGTTLSLKWRVFNSELDDEYFTYNRGLSDWLNAKKLAELGFDKQLLASETYPRRLRQQSAKVFLVLEFDGKLYQQALEQAEKRLEVTQTKVLSDEPIEAMTKELDRHEKRLDRLQNSISRLYVIDAGLDRQLLLNKYADKKRYMLLQGNVRLRWSDDKVRGYISKIFQKEIYVPLLLAEQLKMLTEGERYSAYRDEAMLPRYQIRLNIGQQMEPWVESVSRY